MKRITLAILMVGALALSYGLGRHRTSRESSNHGGRRLLYYVDPMHPAYKSDKPGIAPDCGMQLVPVYGDDTGNVSPSAPAAQLSPETVSIDGNMQHMLGIEMATVETSGGNQVLRVVGRVVPEDTRVYKVDSGMEGFVRETYNDSVGTLVKKDQKLATYYGPESLAVASGYLAATERVPGAVGHEGSRTLPYPGTLSKQGLSSIQGYSDRLRNLGMSGVQIEQMAASGQLPESVDVVAPADGFILARNITPGEHFFRSTEFYRIADLSRVWVIAEIFENEAQYFRPGAVARVTLPGQSKGLLARITDVLPEIDPATRTLQLRLEADNPHFALRPDMFVDVELSAPAPPGLTVPRDAVIDFGLTKRVFVERGNGVFEPREVETGWQFGDRVQIVTGLQAGERVVAAGTFLLDSESRLRAAATGSQEAAPDNHEPAPSRSEPRLKPVNATKAARARDPKCGMQVDRAKALAHGNALEYRGTTYYFCSKQCKEAFGKDPDRYLAAGPDGTGSNGAGHD